MKEHGGIFKKCGGQLNVLIQLFFYIIVGICISGVIVGIVESYAILIVISIITLIIVYLSLLVKACIAETNMDVKIIKQELSELHSEVKKIQKTEEKRPSLRVPKNVNTDNINTFQWTRNEGEARK